MTVEYTMSEPTHGEDDRPAGGRGGDVQSTHRPAAGKMHQEHDRYRLAGGYGIPFRKSSLSRQASLQVSREMACLELNSNKIEGYQLAPDAPRIDGGENRGVPPRNARREVSKSKFLMILHPAIGNLRKESIDLHPSVGYFRRK